MVCPTNSGKIVESRDQVRMIWRWLDRFSASSLAKSFSSTKGPFLVDRDIDWLAPYGVRLLLPAPDDVLVGLLVAARARAHGRLAPLGLRLAADRRASLATAVRVVVRVHDRATDAGTPAHVARTSGLADVLVLMIRIADHTDGGAGRDGHQTHLARGHAQGGVVAFARHQLRGGAGGAHQLSAAPGIQLDGVHRCAHGDVAQRQTVAGADLGLGTAHHAIADLQAKRRDDVALLAILVEQQGDARGAVRIVLDGGHARRDAVFVALEVDDAVHALVPAAAVPRGQAALVVAAGLRLERPQQGLVRLAGGDVVERRHRHAAPAGRGGLISLDSHLYTVPKKSSISCPCCRVTMAFFQALV